MSNTLKTLAVFLSLLPAGCATTAAALGPSNEPQGHAIYCKMFAEHCKNHPPTSLTSNDVLILAKVNTEVNRSIHWTSDKEHYGLSEVWTPKAVKWGKGDCEDYALAKRQRLVSLGFPQGAFRLAVINKFSWKEAHVVLLASVGKQTLILDSMTHRLEDARDLGVSWEALQEKGQPRVWIKNPDENNLNTLLTSLP